MEIIWHGYACFELVSGGYTVVLDPYRSGTLAGFPPLDVCADEVLCSHGHDGHGAADAVKLRRSGAPAQGCGRGGMSGRKRKTRGRKAAGFRC